MNEKVINSQALKDKYVLTFHHQLITSLGNAGNENHNVLISKEWRSQLHAHKVHKKDVPVRPIVSGINSGTYVLSKNWQNCSTLA